MNFLLRTPFFRLLLALIAGIVTCRYFRLFDLTMLLLAVPAFLSVFLSFWVKNVQWAHRLRWGFGAGFVVLVYLVGYVQAARQEHQLQFNFSGKSQLYRLKLVESPEVKDRSVLCVAETRLVDGGLSKMDHPAGKLTAIESSADKPTANETSAGTSASMHFSAKTIVYLQKESSALQLQRGDILIARLRFQAPAPVQNPEGFDYAAFLRRKGIAATAYSDSLNWRKLSHTEIHGLRHWAEKARDQLLAIYRKLNLATDEFAVLAALTLGFKEELEPDVMLDYSASGAMHILSVSGLHVGVIFLIVNSLVSMVFRKPSTLIPKSVLIILALWLYAFITGLSPSVIRASAMFSMVTLGKALGRQAQIYNTISSTAFILLLMNPSYLWDVGFQLSYTAVLGIVYFQPQLSPLLAVSNKALKWLWDLTSVSLAAQLGTLPLALYYFNQFPNYFLLTNYIAIPLSGFVIYAAVGYLVLYWVPLVGGVAGWMVDRLLWLLNSAVAAIHALPGSVTQIYAGQLDLLLMTILLCCWVGYAELKRYYFIPVALSVVLLFPLKQIISEVHSNQHSELIVYSDRKASHVQLNVGRREFVITSDSVAFVKVAGKYRLKKRLLTQQFVVDSASWFNVLDGKRFGLINDKTYCRKKAGKPLHLDYLIINSMKGYKPKELFSCFEPRICISGSSVSEYSTARLQEECKAKGITFFSLRCSGAYRELLNRTNRKAVGSTKLEISKKHRIDLHKKS